MRPAHSRIDPQELRDSVGDSFNIFQATIAMVAIFTGFVFAGLLEVLLAPAEPSGGAVVVLWLLTGSMVALTAALILFHATAHRVFWYWGIFYPVSVFNRLGALAFSVGVVLMFMTVAVLLWEKGQHGPAVVAGASGVVLMAFGYHFRRMHRGGGHMVNVDDAPPDPHEGAAGAGN